MRGRLLAGVLLAAAAAAPADARTISARYELSGAVLVSWQGAPGRCEAAAACGVQGTLTYFPRASGEFALSGNFSSSSSSGVSSPAVVRVERPGGGTCVDSVGGGTELETLPEKLFDHRLVLSVSGGLEEGLSAGRCAGPVASEVAARLPRATLPVRPLRRPRTLDLGGRTPFAAGPFDAEIVSTVRLKLRPEADRTRVLGGRTPSPRGGPPPPAPAGARLPRFVQARARYAIEPVAGEIVHAYAGDGAACSLLDACGASGRIAIAPPEASALHVFGRARLPRGRRPPATLAELMRLPGAVVQSNVVSGEPATVTHESTRLGAPTCRSGAQVSLDLVGRVRPDRFRLVLRPGYPVDTGRTHCPGPALVRERFGGGQMASGAVDARRLDDRSFAIALTPRNTIGDGAYTGSVSGSLEFALRRERLRFDVGTWGP